MLPTADKTSQTTTGLGDTRHDPFAHLRDVSPELVTLNDPRSRAAKMIRTLQSQILHTFVDQGLRSFAIIADAPGRGTSFLAANLAFAFAQSAYRTALVDANLVASRQAAFFGLDPETYGLADVIQSRSAASTAKAMVPLAEYLAIIPAGPRHASPHLLQHDVFPQIMTNLPRLFDITICDSPSADDLDGAIATASAVDRVIILTREDKTELAKLKKLTTTLQNCNAKIAGTVISQW